MRRSDGASAVDLLVDTIRQSASNGAAWGGVQPWHRTVIAELLVSGAPVLPRSADIVLPIAVSHGFSRAARSEAELAARRSERGRQRAREDLVGLARDVAELREAEKAVRRREARVAELEEALGEGEGGRDEEEDEDGDGGDE